MFFSLKIPTKNLDVPLAVSIATGEVIFVLGANGTGKSSLMHAFATANYERARRITAHRQNWFRSGSPEFTGRQRADNERNIVSYDRQPNSRWMDDFSDIRAPIAIYDLVNSENVRARDITKAVDQKNNEEVQKLAAKNGAFAILNRLLRLANIDIVVSIEANDEIMAIRSGSKPYSIARLSDGERNAILIAANVLTVPPETLLLIDEPERHLHRSIVSPLLSLLIKERPDCAFVVSTHEPLLPVDNPRSRTLLTRACAYDGDKVTSYDIDLLEETDAIDDDLKRTILGERRKIVFVEGNEHSLDKPLYSLLFPNASIVAMANCREVVKAVIGIRNTTGLHWVKPFGLVDNDSAEPAHIADLKSKGVIALNVYSVESIYYHPEVQKLAASKLAEVVPCNLEAILSNANEDAISAIRKNASHLSERIAEKEVRAQVFKHLPKKGDVAAGGTRTNTIDYTKIARDEATRLTSLLDSCDFLGVLQRYPIRESGAIDAIVKALNFRGRADYEDAVRKILVDDLDSVSLVRGLLGPLPDDLTTSGTEDALE